MGKKEVILDLVQKMEPLDIIVTTQRTFSGWWIRQQTTSQWSHVCLYGEPGKIYTTDWRYSKVDAIKYLSKQDSFAVYRMPGLSDNQRSSGVTICQSFIGQTYPILDVISMSIQNFFNPGKKKLWFDNKNMICSQGVAYVYENIRSKLAPQKGLHYSMYRPDSCIDDQRLVLVGGFNI